jgi:hypothetical protein
MFFSTAIPIRDIEHIGDRRNLVIDEWYLRKGERRLGEVAFPIGENGIELFQVAVQCKDHTGQMIDVSSPPVELIGRLKAAGQLPWKE